MSIAYYLHLTLFHAAHQRHLSPNSEKNFLFCISISIMLLLTSPQVCWKDVIHSMWPLFTENWGSWRYDDLHLSPCPFTDPVTGIPTWHHRPQSPLMMYGFGKEVVECPEWVF